MEQTTHYTTIHYSKFDRLLEITNSYKKAAFIDKIIYWYKTSNYTLPGSDSLEVWFTRSYDEMSKQCHIPISTLKSYMKQFVDAGYIKRVQKQYGAKINVYFQITKLLITTIETKNKYHKPDGPKLQLVELKTDKKNLEQTKTIDNLESISSTYDIDKKRNTNIINRVPRKEKQGKLYNAPKSVTDIFEKVGERLEDFQKSIIWGAICNLQKQHSKNISNISEFVAWISFSIINAKHQLKKTFNFSHQLNCLMKIARSSQGLQKPRGFHNHWDIGQELKSIQAERSKKHEASKKAGQGLNIFKAIESSDVENTSGIGYVIAKKANELWNDSGEIKKLKAQKGAIKSTINSLKNEIKSLPLFYKNHPDMLKVTMEQAKIELQEFIMESKLINERIEKIKSDEQMAKAQDWQPLYA